MPGYKKIWGIRLGEGSSQDPGYKRLVDDETINKCLSELENESDRSSVLVVSSFIEEIMAMRLRELFSHGSEKILKAMFEANGPLSTLRNKSDILYCMGDIPKKIYDDINIIRRVRNNCAHNWDSFRIDRVFEVQLINKIANESALEMFETEGFTPKMRFIFLCATLISWLSLQSVAVPQQESL